MSSPPDIPTQDELALIHRAALARLREKGMDLADRLHASADEPDADIGEIATRFARVARTVRQTIALEARLADETRRREQADAAEAARQAALEEQRRLWAEEDDDYLDPDAKRLEAVSLIQRAFARDVDRERLEDDFYERLLDERDWDVVLTAQDVSKAIDCICKDLGFTPDWPALSDRDWKLARPETKAALLGAPDDGPIRQTLGKPEWQLAP